MAGRPDGGETPLRRSRRLEKGTPMVQSEEGEGAAGEGDRPVEGSDLQRVRGHGKEVPPSIEAIEESPQEEGGMGGAREVYTVKSNGDIVLLSDPHDPSNEGTTMGGSEGENKRKHQEVFADPCKRPLLGAKEPQAEADPPSAKKEEVIPKGKPKSGRTWKDQNKKRFSGMVKDRPLHSSWDKKMKARQEKRLVKDFAQHLRDEKQKAKDEKKKRREENLKRRLENERKGEIVQVIMNPAKIKRAKKKQLRRIEKRDTLALLQGRSVPRKKAMGKAKPASAAKPNAN